MSRLLISNRNVDEYIKGDKFYVTKEMIITSGVKDYLKEKGISLVYGEEETCEESSIIETLEDKIKRILKEDFNIVDENITQIVLKICKGVKD